MFANFPVLHYYIQLTWDLQALWIRILVCLVFLLALTVSSSSFCKFCDTIISTRIRSLRSLSIFDLPLSDCLHDVLRQAYISDILHSLLHALIYSWTDYVLRFFLISYFVLYLFQRLFIKCITFTIPPLLKHRSMSIRCDWYSY